MWRVHASTAVALAAFLAAGASDESPVSRRSLDYFDCRQTLLQLHEIVFRKVPGASGRGVAEAAPALFNGKLDQIPAASRCWPPSAALCRG